MLRTNCGYLRNEIMDVVRLFGAEDEDIDHYFSYSDGEFYNCVSYGGGFRDFAEPFDPADDVEYRRFAKRYAKLAVYETLSEAKGVRYPWGALTGIRPTKIYYSEKAAGRDPEALLRRFGVSEDNVRLLGRVVAGQSAVYGRDLHSGCDLFVSVPFCPTKCEYCSFITAPLSRTACYVEDYVDCLVRETEAVSPYVGKVNSIYVGGGTPFTLSCSQLDRVLGAACAYAGDGCEITVEAGRPDTFTEEKLGICRDHGVGRICVNPQSFSDDTLSRIGREHTVKDVYAAYEAAERFGFDINMDLIAGLPGEGTEEFSHSVDCAISLAPANVTVHTLCLKSGARMKESVSRLDVDGIDDMVSLSRRALTDAGYGPYYLYRQKYQAGGNENVGWCRDGKACVYNVDVMEEICDNVAVGANAISKRVFPDDGRIERLASPKDIRTYIDKCGSVMGKRAALFGGEG